MKFISKCTRFAFQFKKGITRFPAAALASLLFTVSAIPFFFHFNDSPLKDTSIRLMYAFGFLAFFSTLLDLAAERFFAEKK